MFSFSSRVFAFQFLVLFVLDKNVHLFCNLKRTACAIDGVTIVAWKTMIILQLAKVVKYYAITYMQFDFELDWAIWHFNDDYLQFLLFCVLLID